MTRQRIDHELDRAAWRLTRASHTVPEVSWPPPAPGTHESDMHYRRRVTSEHTADNAEWVRAAAWSRIEARKPD